MAGRALIGTDRLAIREFAVSDAPFILELLNEASFKRFIGDKGVRTIDDARRYLEEGPIDSYARHGFGIWLVSRRNDGENLGMCGLVLREGFDSPDLGFAFLERHWANGYAYEAAAAVIAHARQHLRDDRLIAMADDGNAASMKLLEKLGFEHAGTARLPGEDQDVQLYAAAT